MPDFDLIQILTDYPYIGVAAVFLLCGLGLPLPEEIVLLVTPILSEDGSASESATADGLQSP